MRTSWTFLSAGELLFGKEAVRQLPALCARNQWRRLLLVTDSALEAAGVVGRVSDALSTPDLTICCWAGGTPEPALEMASAAAEAARDFQPDAIVGLGGGSNLDVAKMAAVLLRYGGRPGDYCGWDLVPGPVVPIVAIPTTAGTGSEVSHCAVFTDHSRRTKTSVVSNYLRPCVAIVDPQLTLTCPRRTTADSGIDALSHAIEAFTAIDAAKLAVPAHLPAPYSGRHPLGDCLAEKAISLIGGHLRDAVREPDNYEAREGMALAATLGGLAFSNCGVAVVHALEFPVGGTLHCSHGTGNGLLLPHVMRYNLSACSGRFARIAELLGVDVREMDQSTAASAAVDAVDRLRRDIGIPSKIRELGGTYEQLAGFARQALSMERLMLLNPRLPCEADLLGILQAAF